MSEELERKWINPTRGYVGVSKLDGDGKWTAIPVEPNGGAVFLTPAEERKTAEAPRDPAKNPFVREWEEPVEWSADGEVIRTVTRVGHLVLAEEPARPITSERFIPARPGDAPVGATGRAAPAPVRVKAPDGFKAIVHENGEVEIVAQEDDSKPEPEETQTGAPPLPQQPPVEGQPSEDEIVATPEAVPEDTAAAVQGQPFEDEIVGTPGAVAANDETLAARESTPEQPTRKSQAVAVG